MINDKFTTRMNILILGSGGREHAMAWKIKQSNKINKLYIAPGNAGTGTVGENVQISTTDFKAIKQFVLDKIGRASCRERV